MQGILLKIDAFHNIQMGTVYRSVLAYSLRIVYVYCICMVVCSKLGFWATVCERVRPMLSDHHPVLSVCRVCL